MTKKLLLTAIAATLAFCSAHAQVTNRAISFSEAGLVDCGGLPTLDNLSSYTIQLWINPTKWIEGATVLGRGDDFTVKLGKVGSVVFTVGDKSVTATSDDLKSGVWNAVMLICDNGDADAYINNVKSGSGKLAAVPENEASLKLGGGYFGKLDEVRLWKAALSSDFEYFTNNTLNKWAPQWDDLMVYYKMDQADECKVLANYRPADDENQQWNNHGIIKAGVKRVTANNDKLPYLWNAAYTENSRFFDRIIPADQYRLSNGIIILGSDVVPTTGEITLRTPNNHAVEVSGTYVEEFDGRDGVLALSGNQCLMAPEVVMPNTKEYTFESWVYLKEWKDGAYLVRRETADQKHGIAIFMCEVEGDKRFAARINGEVFYSKKVSIPTEKWFHCGFNPEDGGTFGDVFGFYYNGRSLGIDDDATTTSGTNVVPAGNEGCMTYIGEGINGYLDDTCIWAGRGFSMEKHQNYIPLPALNRNVTVADMNKTDAYYRYDDPENLGFSYHSQDNWLKIMQSAFDGYAGAKFYISIKANYADRNTWVQICNNEAKRGVFAKAVAELVKPYDGVELDMEWIEGTQWTNYASMVDSILNRLPEGKEFRVSTHNNYYSLYPKNKITVDRLDGFTFQQYGPQATHFGYQNFVSRCGQFEDYGYPKHLIVTSYSTTTSKGTGGSATIGVRRIFTEDTDPESNSGSIVGSNTGETFSFTGPMQTYNRAKFTRDRGYQGIFYWDMGNDWWLGTVAEPVMPPYNLARWCSYALNSNIDPIMNDARAVHYNADGIYPDPDEEEPGDIETPGQDGIADTAADETSLTVTPSPIADMATVTLPNGRDVASLAVYALNGSTVLTRTADNVINMTGITPGTYILLVKDVDGNQYRKKITKK